MSGKFGGRFILYPDTPQELVIPNSVLSVGRQSFLKMMFNNDQTYLEFYAGLMGQAYTDTTTLAEIYGVSEPTIGTNGYARHKLERTAIDFPNIENVDGEWRARSKLMTWTGVGGEFDRSVSRLFLASVGVGAAGQVFAVSGMLSAPILVSPDNPLPAKYELWYL